MRDGRSLESAAVYGFVSLAKQYDGYIALGLNEVWKGQPFMSMVLIGPEGLIDVYRKTYLWPNMSQQGKKSFDEWLKTYVPHKEGYRCERGILGSGTGTRVIQVGDLRIGCLICADGNQPEAWSPFKDDKPDIIFWQNNHGSSVYRGPAPEHAKELRTPMVGTNRCGFSYHHFQLGGTCLIADDGHVVSKANEKGEEEMIFANLSDLRRIEDKRELKIKMSSNRE